MRNLIELNVLDRCQNCPEFEAETIKEVVYSGDLGREVTAQVICKHRGLCDRILEHLKETSTNSTT